MIYIDRTGHIPDVAWTARADNLTQDLLDAPDTAARNKIIDDNQGIWGELKDFLLGISQNKCWYSEARDAYAHYHVDHFRPKKEALGIDKKDKGGYWWLAFQWTNYRVCGGAGNVRKGAKFAVKANKANQPTEPIEDEIIHFLDPCEEEDVLKITFNEHGEITPITATGWDNQRTLYTIESLNLNFKLLKEKRKEIWTKCSMLLKETQNLMAQNDTAPSATRKGQIKEKIRQLKELVKSTSEFSATAKACLQSAGLRWALQIAA
ncbi:hypothetical protein [Reichenbachiella sp.]|uniref:hypothetical protein n=1 Tax=Reichenbachiella sp. TaxID=2184521 RepID=UPI003296BA60